jgi:hydroxyquinol 1,2-dioxygenase
VRIAVAGACELEYHPVHAKIGRQQSKKNRFQETTMPYVTEQNLTDVALQRWKDIPDPRLRQVMQSLIKHLHGFVRDIEPTQAEWATAIDWLTRTGQMCSQKRQEFILTSDVLGVSMLVDAINHRRPGAATPSTVEGPFHVPDAPPVANGGDMAKGAPGIPCFVTGIVRDLDGRPVAGAELDLWQTDGEGLYEDQRDTQGPYMRGLYRAQPDGTYAIRTVAPIAYTIPMDGTVGELMNRTNISHMRPAHIHFAITAPGYHGLVTHLFQKGDKFIETDVVYGVKEPLIVEFVKKPAGKAPTGETVGTPFYEVRYDFVLERRAEALAAAE